MEKEPEMKTARKRRKQRVRRIDFDALSLVDPNAAGIDVGGSTHWVAVPSDRDAEPVREFSVYTSGLHELANWISACGVASVAMESTGVLWVPLYEILEKRGIRVCLVNARHVKNVPGRKSDILDCQWLQKLHAYGLLQASFRPEADFVKLRTYLRHRESLMQSASAHIQRMQKSLTLMNVQLHRAITDVTGETGMRIIRDIVSGQHEPKELAKHRDHRCKASEEEIAEALRGEYREEHLFVLRQALELYDAYQAQILACDLQIERMLEYLRKNLPQVPPAALSKPRASRKKKRAKEFLPDVREALYCLTLGVDLTLTTGLGELTALQLIAEIGTDMSRWPTAGHFVSWTTLAPSCRITGGKRLASHRAHSAHPVARILRLSAVNAGKTQTAIGAFYRRLAASKGSAKAVVATAAKLARIIFTMLKNRTSFNDPGANAYELRYRDRVVRNLKRRAAELGFDLQPTTCPEGAPV